jgi:iron complex transport system ATP-binding protein
MRTAVKNHHKSMHMKAAPFLEARHLAVGYRRPRQEPHAVVEGIDVALREGELVCLLGPNGAGKSTLIRTLCGIQPVLAGQVLLAGEPLADLSARLLAQRMSLVLTERVAVGLMPVATLVTLGRHPYTRWSGRLGREDRETVWRAMADAGVEDLAYRPVCELSDGERQKVMIARALAQEPRVMILDEATAFLDLPRRVELMHLLRRLTRSRQRAILLSTHDLDLALRCADRLWLLPPGGPLQHGTPEDLVLSGAFAGAFASEGVQFDPGSGAFTLQETKRGTVALRGDGITGMWTYRALERAGYQVAPEGGAALCIDVIENNGAPAWRIVGCDGTLPSLEALLTVLNQHSPDQRGERS